MPTTEAIRRTTSSVLSAILDPTLRAIEISLVAISALMVFVVFLQVCLRYFFNTSFYGSDELSRYLFTWFVFLGATCALSRGLHFAVEIIVDSLPAGLQRAIRTAIHIIILVILVVILVNGIDLAIQNWQQLSSSMRIPLTFPYAAIPVSAAVMILVTLRKLMTPADSAHAGL